MLENIHLGHGIGELREIPLSTQQLIRSALEIVDEYSRIMKQARLENPEIFNQETI